MMGMSQICFMSMHLTRSNRFPSAGTEVHQDVTMRDVIDLVDSEDVWEEAEMSRRCIAAQQDVAMHVDSKDVRGVAEMSGSHTAVEEDVREVEMSGSHPVTTRVKHRTSICASCQGIMSNSLYEWIIGHIEIGIHENTPLTYHPIGSLTELMRQKSEQLVELHLMKLNKTRKVLVKIAALDDHKKWVLAVDSRRVDRVAALVQAGRGKKLGVKGLITQYEQAVRKLYKPMGFTREEIMMSIVLLQIGGNRMGSFAHLAMSLPSVTTARRNVLLQPISVLALHPTVSEIEENIKSCFALFKEVLDALPMGTIKHQVLMLDEIAIEKRPQWDNKTNLILGLCCEHSHKVSLNFSMEKELDFLCDSIDNGHVHVASEVSKLNCFFILGKDFLIL